MKKFVAVILLMGIAFSVHSQGLWPSFHNDAQRTGYAPRPGSPDNTLLWEYETLDKICASAAISQDYTTYIGSRDNYLHAIDKDGNLKWKFLTSDDVVSSAAIGSEGTIYFGSLDGKLYAVEDSVTYGKLRWQFTSSGTIRSPILIGAKGVLYFKAEPNKFFAVNPDGSEKWSYAPVGGVLNDGTGLTLSPDSTTLYFIAGTGTAPMYDVTLFALDTSGVEKWTFSNGMGEFPFNYAIDVSPLVDADGIIYVPTLDKPFFAINPNGTEKWRTSFNLGVLRSSPALGPTGVIYVGTGGSTPDLYAINSVDGSLVWKYLVPSGRQLYNSPAVDASGIIYFGDKHNWNVYALNPDMTLKWTFTPGVEEYATPFFDSSPVIAWDSTIVFGSPMSYKVYAVGRPAPPTGIEMSSFSAAASKYGIVLSWRTESETSIAQYLLKRSEGESAYREIARIPCSGSSPSPKTYSYRDEDVKIGIRYYYKLGVVKTDGNTKWYGPVSAIVTEIKGYLKVSPNPFRDRVSIEYGIGQSAKGIELKIFDVGGRLVKNLSLGTGHSALGTEVIWDGKDDNGKVLPSGIYYCRLTNRIFTQTKKILFVR